MECPALFDFNMWLLFLRKSWRWIIEGEKQLDDSPENF